MSGASRPSLERWGPLAWALAALVVWEAVARLAGSPGGFFPAPSRIAAVGWRLVSVGDLGRDTVTTLGRTLAGVVLGAGPGFVLGLVMGAWPRLGAQLDPLVAAAHPVPKVAMLPLLLVLLGIGESSKVALAALGAFFPMLINTVAGVRGIAPTHFEVARSYGARGFRLFRRVVLPGSLPLVLTGLRLAANAALTLTVAGELVVGDRGLGYRLWLAWETMHVAEVWAGLAVIAVLGIGLSGAVERLRTWAMPWAGRGGVSRSGPAGA